ncbi:MAG: NADH:flavin oxidoreductase [Deltaproteobacteria bacterium]|nr:NADH:flavin oxidoreductase [Deltaproteobacteria bacterium]
MLFDPLTFPCGLVVPNRIALAPMTNGQSLPDGRLGDDELAWLARRADGGFGMIETCAAYVALEGKAWAGELGVDRDDDSDGLARLAERIKRGGAAAIVQLFHGGVRATQKLTGEQVWSASSFHEDTPGFETPRAATDADVARVIEQFADAAVRCERAGFDGVELHGAHGYLLSQFLSRTMNPRPFEERARLIRETTRAVRARTGARFCVGVRLSLEDRGHAKGLDLDESLQVAAWLAEDGAEFIHASLWDASKPTTKRPAENPIPLLRKALPPAVRVIVAGTIWTHDEAEAALAKGADMVAIGRAAILNPDWPRTGAEHRPPMRRAELADRAVSPVFVEYLTRWKGFVAD